MVSTKKVNQFKLVCDYIRNKTNTNVVLGSMTCFMGHFTNRIVIHHNYNLEKNGLISLLHECGHALQPSKYTGPNEYKKYDEDSEEFKIGRYYNEVDAWNKAEMIVKELNLSMDWKRFNSQRKHSLKTYEY